jgi:hypothetical protein
MLFCSFIIMFFLIHYSIPGFRTQEFCPQNENFDLLVRIKLENLFFMYFEI